ncbi:MAG: hypothetical protein AAF141_08185, partial [Pseudomonadota bacterium]
KFGLGNISLCYEIEWAKNHGFNAYDFGAGTESYKERFGGELCRQYSSIQALSSAGRIYLTALEHKNTARRLKRRATSFGARPASLADLVPKHVARLRQQLKTSREQFSGHDDHGQVSDFEQLKARK